MRMFVSPFNPEQDGVWGVRRNCAVALADLSKAIDPSKRCDLCSR